MAPLVSRLLGRKKRTSSGSSGRADDASFLRPYGFLACGPRVWEPMQKRVVFSIRITNHAEERKHTQYHIECSLTWPADDGTHVSQSWSTDRRLKHFRVDLHDPVKAEIAGTYKRLFRQSRFARSGGLKGTTARLNKWFERLCECINSREVPPVVVASVLTALDAPEPPSTKPSCIEEPIVSLPSTTVSACDDEDSDSLSDLGLSDASEDSPAANSAGYPQSGLGHSCESAETTVETSASVQEFPLSPTGEAPVSFGGLPDSEFQHYDQDAAPAEENAAADYQEEAGDAAEQEWYGDYDYDTADGSGQWVEDDMKGSLKDQLQKVTLKPKEDTPQEVLQTEVKANSKFQAKLNARRALVDLQKLSGRGMVIE